MAVALDDGDDGVVRLRVAHLSDALDGPAAARILGYHLAALSAMAADPGADARAAGLLSPAELEHQLSGLAGPHRRLPRRRPHELLRDQAAARPDDVAVVHGDVRWTYRELVDRADRLSRALLARGLRPEDVVGVVTERTPDWAAAVLAVLQAGGAYLPLEPHFPAGRIGTVLTRAGCRLVLTERGSRTTLDEALAALPEVRAVDIGAGHDEPSPAVALPVPVAADQLAYLYFTSGSTGEPKGAMCEHAGMLNHLLAKIDDLGIVPGQVVAQTAPQCFDISLWQLLAAPIAGARTVIVPQDVILDVPRFVATVTAERVTVLQLVPSYLDLVLTYLEEHPAELADLRVVSVTGEAVTPELVRRFFAVLPGRQLVNAYGLTETSDDTNHAVLDRPPHDGRVPLGPPIANVRVSVVDDDLRPVPLGAPGEIVFSGVCVGRGYVNDPQRTAAAFLADPRCPGERLYRSGDQGRWRPDGALEFLGRRDSQVKIAGFRIEIGEVDNALLRVPGVRDAAVVVADRGGRDRSLVAFWTGEDGLDAGTIAHRLAETLPAYMVPAAFVRRDRLPVTANGKVDRKALSALAGELADEPVAAAPRTATERRLAAVWARVLGVPVEGIGRTDSFFGRGGTSLTAVRLAIALDRAVSLPDIVRAPVLADLARVLDERAGDGRTDDARPALSVPHGSP
jgi:amino acid adenylation domain-containing protein